MIKHIYIPNKSDNDGYMHKGPMLCGVPPSLEGQYALEVYKTCILRFDNTWCGRCKEKTDLAILATTDL